MTTDNQLPPQHLRRELFAHAEDLAMLPSVANEALQLAQDTECRSSDFSQVVERDPNLVTDLLTLANSAVFSCGRSVATVQQAVVRLGLRQCRNLILNTCISSAMKNLPLQQAWVRELVWEHSYRTATACAHLNRKLRLGYQGEEFTAGLLHDFGRLLLAIVAPDTFADADPLDFMEDSDLLERERELIGTDHCSFGAWFANHNGLPSSLAAAIRYHHGGNEPDHPDARLIALTIAGDDIANHLQRVGEAAGYEPELNPGIDALSRCVPGDIETRFIEQLPAIFEDLICDIGMAEEESEEDAPSVEANA
ncbi:MAG: HDOD domain-containing protein [Planctomycetota bacterium]